MIYLNEYIDRVIKINNKLDEVSKSLDEKKMMNEFIKQKTIYE